MAAAFVLSARRRTKSFGDLVALDGVDLAVADGRIRGRVVPNGAGKTCGFSLGTQWPPPWRISSDCRPMNGYVLVRTVSGDAPNRFWQFDGVVDLLPTS